MRKCITSKPVLKELLMEVLQVNVKFHRDIWNLRNNKRTEDRATEMVTIWVNRVAYFTPHKFFKICRTTGSKNYNIVRLCRCNIYNNYRESDLYGCKASAFYLKLQTFNSA